MEQLSFIAQLSPCIGVCQNDNRGYCRGCLRSRDERFRWQTMSEQEKAEVNRLCQRRRRSRQYQAYQLHQQQKVVEQRAQNLSFDFPEPSTDLSLESTTKKSHD